MSTHADYTVVGMTCQHCVQSVSTGLLAVPGVTGVDVDLGTGLVRVTSDAPLSDESVSQVIDEAGYTLVASAEA